MMYVYHVYIFYLFSFIISLQQEKIIIKTCMFTIHNLLLRSISFLVCSKVCGVALNAFAHTDIDNLLR